MSESPNPTQAWSLPNTLEARAVLPDRFTEPSTLQDLPGKETDPGRMGIYLCLLDDRPHLHPNLAALHKHRLVAHDIPSPANPSVDLPLATDDVKEWMTWKFGAEEEARRKAYLPLA